MIISQNISILHFVIIYSLIQNTLSFIPTSNFFPFGIQNGDQETLKGDDLYSGPINLTKGFKFFNDTYSQLYVSNNGAISFKKGIQKFTPTCGALDEDNTMIAPFWTDIDSRNGGDIFYRESTNNSLLFRAEQEIKNGFPNVGNISFERLFIVTWFKVSFFGSRDSDCVEETQVVDPRNTFQVVLSTGHSQSFVIFYYGELKWTTGLASNGNCSGLGGFPAKAGFDVGDGKTFFTLPGSCTHQILNIAETTNVNKGEGGQWIFKVDTTFQEADDCDDSMEEPLEFKDVYYKWDLEWGSDNETHSNIVGFVRLNSKVNCVIFGISSVPGQVEPYLSIGKDGKVTSRRTSQDLLDHQGQVDVFIVTATRWRNGTVESAKVPIVIHNKPDGTTFPPVPCECPTCPTERSTIATTNTEVNFDPSTTTTAGVGEFSCSKEGYFADPRSCPGFFRCVGNGNSFTRYEYTCPAGNIWCQSNVACSFSYQCQEGCGCRPM